MIIGTGVRGAGMKDNSKRIAALIRELWSNGSKIERLPADVVLSSRRDGYLVQAELEAASGTRAGWKIAATSKAGQAHINVDGPLAGRVFKDTVFKPGCSLSLKNNLMRVAEPEFAFVFGESLGPRARAYSVDDVMNTVSALHLAIELPDSRLEAFVEAGAAGLLADNACTHQLVLGDAVSVPWKSIDLSKHPVEMRNGAEAFAGFGANVLGDPRIALAWLVTEVTDLGLTIEAGEFVTTGTTTTPVPVSPGDRLEADFGLLGVIGVELTD